MDQIFNKVHTVDPNNGEAVKEALTVFFQNLVKQKEFNCNKWLRELKTIINRFPKYCMSHRSNTEAYIVHFINSNNYFNVIEAAKCAHALQQVRPTKEKTATPTSCWRDQMTLLCNAAHTLLSAVFPDAVDMYKDSEMSEIAAKSPLSVALTEITKKFKNLKDKQSLLHIRLKNVLIFIQAMLVEMYPVAKPIRPQIILDVIIRALSVTSGTNIDVNIASVKIQSLRTLDALIMCLGANLIPFSPLIIRCVMQTLRWSSENAGEEQRKVRSTAYNTLTNWLNTLHVHRASDNRNQWEDELTTHIVEDITPPKKVVQLTMGPQPTKHLSKKAKRKLATTQMQESSIAAHMPGEKNKIVISEEINNEVAMAALECSEMFLTVCGRFLKPATHKLIQERIVRECYNHTSYTDNHLIYLLRVLESSRKTTPLNVPPPTQYCLHLYSTLVNMQSIEISKFCTQALLDIRLHLHCSPPSINFAIEVPQETEKQSNLKQISELNRTVLQSLLGATKLPGISTENEIITIPDEPSNKKPRLDIDESDKISLSSESVQSLGNSDESGAENMEIEVNVELNNTNDSNNEPIILNESTENGENDSVTMDERDKSPKQIEPTKESVNETKEQEKVPIHEITTQIDFNTSTETIEHEKPSQEVGYDFVNAETKQVTFLETNYNEILPSSNETDELIPCGQRVADTEEIDVEKKIESELQLDISKVNGIENGIKENGYFPDDINNEDTDNNKTSTDNVTDTDNANSKVAKNDGISVEDMLADFVDEVVDVPMEA
ncbi:proline-, glutamic acid- and leucine-rich protein 1-like [Melitaea cinxia]|uniref:proline-, glutamic acid- and leucine-rich protein 1-like n=1 Tax=Melitaea cinxia TaxID=113334 RepID=UPI001E2727F4|nr:proline-, glutamic acid- and leucine-rich protein 1-like [Melitaea cinxia]